MDNNKKKLSELKLNPSVVGISKKAISRIVNEWYNSDDTHPFIEGDVEGSDGELLINQIDDCIKYKGGEISKHTKILHLALTYINLSQKGKARFLEILVNNFDFDWQYIEETVKLVRNAKNQVDALKYENKIKNALIPPYHKLLLQFASLPDGFIFLKDMREDVLSSIKNSPRLKTISDCLKSILLSYFDVNLLDLIEITWESPAALLEKLIEYEAVHEIRSWRELKHRLQTDHRIFAFCHNKMPNDPLIFVEVALVNGMANNIINLIDIHAIGSDPKLADTAIFYSISSTQKGLEGISLGNFLIKRVVRKLKKEFENLKTFATLSPIPLFMNWLTTYLQNDNPNFFYLEEEKRIIEFSKHNQSGKGFLEILKLEQWFENNEICNIVKKPLMRLCAHYLFNVKRGPDNKAYDPVANFHLSNGAKIEHIHWLADTTPKGIRQSAGIMLNYHYRLDKIVINHENYFSEGKIHASSDAKSWLY